jgi:hypothetical protein
MIGGNELEAAPRRRLSFRGSARANPSHAPNQGATEESTIQICNSAVAPGRRGRNPRRRILRFSSGEFIRSGADPAMRFLPSGIAPQGPICPARCPIAKEPPRNDRIHGWNGKGARR